MIFDVAIAAALICNVVGPGAAFQRSGELLYYPATVEERATLRLQTDRTQINASGEEEPIYEIQEPEPGATFIQIELLLASQTPRSLDPQDIVLVDSDGRVFTPERAAVNLGAAPHDPVVVDDPIEVRNRLALDLVYRTPAADWPSLVLRVDEHWLEPLATYIEAPPEAR